MAALLAPPNSLYLTPGSFSDSWIIYTYGPAIPDSVNAFGLSLGSWNWQECQSRVLRNLNSAPGSSPVDWGLQHQQSARTDSVNSVPVSYYSGRSVQKRQPASPDSENPTPGSSCGASSCQQCKPSLPRQCESAPRSSPRSWIDSDKQIIISVLWQQCYIVVSERPVETQLVQFEFEIYNTITLSLMISLRMTQKKMKKIPVVDLVW